MMKVIFEPTVHTSYHFTVGNEDSITCFCSLSCSTRGDIKLSVRRYENGELTEWLSNVSESAYYTVWCAVNDIMNGEDVNSNYEFLERFVKEN